MDITFGSTADASCYDTAKIHEYLGRGWVVAVNGSDYNIVTVNASEVTLVPSNFDTGDPIPGAQPIMLRWDQVSTLHIY